MREIIIEKNDSGQRLDRFLKKYLKEAPLSTIYKYIRRKKISVNNKKVKPERIIEEGDIIRFFMAEEELESYLAVTGYEKSNLKLKIIYEDENIVLINKDIGVLSHSSQGDYKNNVVDALISYLISKGDYVPRLEKTFTPAVCNRLDRNTSGIIIGAKNYEALKMINENIRRGKVKRYYLTIVKGKMEKDQILEAYLEKDEEENKVKIFKDGNKDDKKIVTKLRLLDARDDFSLLEVELLTGRTHQIRAHLASINHSIIGDLKYGDKKLNKYFKEKYNLNGQFLHSYKVAFYDFQDSLAYLNNKEFTADLNSKYERIKLDYFNF